MKLIMENWKRYLKEIDEQEDKTEEEECFYSPRQRKQLADLEKKYPNRDKDKKQAAAYTAQHKKIKPEDCKKVKKDDSRDKKDKS